MGVEKIGLQLDTGGDDVPLRVSDLEFLNQNDWTVTVPSFVFDFLMETTDAQVLAKPQLRISEGERARLRIGDRVPVPVTSFNTANTVGSNVVPITSYARLFTSVEAIVGQLYLIILVARLVGMHIYHATQAEDE